MTNYELKNLLAPIDFSPVSFNALNTAISISVKHGASLNIIHVLENTRFLYTAAGGLSAIALLPELLRTANEKLNEIASKIRKEHNINVRYGVLTGNPAEAICQEASRDHADLVVLGSHGTSNLKEVLIGSTAYTVVRSSSAPVLSVPDDNSWLDFRKILFPIRTHSNSFEKYEFVRPIIKKEGSSVFLAAIVDKNDPNSHFQVENTTEDIYNKLVAEEVICGVQFYECKNQARQVLEIANSEKPDLIVITSTIGRSIWDFFLVPYPQDIVNHSRFPVLSIRPSIEVKAQLKAVKFVDDHFLKPTVSFG